MSSSPSLLGNWKVCFINRPHAFGHDVYNLDCSRYTIEYERGTVVLENENREILAEIPLHNVAGIMAVEDKT